MCYGGPGTGGVGGRFLLSTILYLSLATFKRGMRRLTSPDKGVHVSIRLASRVRCSMARKGRALVSGYIVNLRATGRRLNVRPGLGGMMHRGMGRRLAPVMPLGFSAVAGHCGRLLLGFGKNCSMRFHTFSSKFTCHFLASLGNRRRVVGRVLHLGFISSYLLRLRRPSNFGASCRRRCHRRADDR